MLKNRYIVAVIFSVLIPCLIAASSDSDDQYERGVVLYNAQKYTEALRELSAINTDVYPLSIYLIARCHHRLKHYDKAIIFYEKYLRQVNIGENERKKAQNHLAEAQTTLVSIRRGTINVQQPIQIADPCAGQTLGAYQLFPLKESSNRPALIPVHPGSFQMGSSKNELGHVETELLHPVCITQGYWIMETEVTQGQYAAVMGQNPVLSRGWRGGPHALEYGDRGEGECHPESANSARPVYCVDFWDALKYANRLSELEKLEKCYILDEEKLQWPKKLSCKGYRLPTEAEWEYAARAGQKAIYAGSNSLDEIAWYAINSNNQTGLVKNKKPNAWGLYDMTGNVSEWVWDIGAPYKLDNTVDPMGPLVGTSRVVRGGARNSPPAFLRIAYRSWNWPGLRVLVIGFRLVRSGP